MRVLVSVDDDPVLPAVLGALDAFVKLANWDELLLLHVVAPHPLFPIGAEGPPARSGEALLSRVARRLGHLRTAVETLVVHGDPAPEIARVADESEADLVVMGALGGRREFLMGSVSQKVVSLADTDVLVVREPAEGLREGSGGLFRALLAVDGSLGSEAGIEAFARKLRARRATIRLVHVVESVPSLWQTSKDERIFSFSFARQANEVLGRAQQLLARKGLQADCEWRQGSPAGQILEVARNDGTDLIVVGSRGHSAIRDMVLGSITQRVLRHAPCTVFCARGWAPESAQLPASWASDEWEPEVGMA